jgi:hypothetical protein
MLRSVSDPIFRMRSFFELMLHHSDTSNRSRSQYVSDNKINYINR